MPVLIEILAISLVLFCLFLLYSNRAKAQRRIQEQEQKQTELMNQLDAQISTIQQNVAAFEKRLTNVEMIVTDANFVDPPTSGREAIDLKSELTELKAIIKNLQK